MALEHTADAIRQIVGELERFRAGEMDWEELAQAKRAAISVSNEVIKKPWRERDATMS